MTPKEKAQELVQRFIDEAYAETTEQLYTPIAKKAALIAVNEILKECVEDKQSYWQEVKQEIKNF
jgi:hypothetical protein